MLRSVRSGAGVLVVVMVAAVAGAGALFRVRLRERAKVDSRSASASSNVAVPPGSVASPEPLVGAPSGAGLWPSPSASAAQALAAALPLLPEHSHPDPRSGTLCPPGMLLVDGSFCPAVAHFCAEWIHEDPTDTRRVRAEKRCRRYEKRLVCEGDMAHLHVCIDRFEYPNFVATRPAMMTSYRDASAACAVEGKRLCDTDEWTLACEGPRSWPYPTGLERDPKRCPIDRPRRPPNEEALAQPADVALEVARLDQRTKAGANPGCASYFGVHDLTGNVAEWVHDRYGQRGAPRSDIALAGGGWEPATATCRAQDSFVSPDVRNYLTGFRCCANSLDGVPPRRKLGHVGAHRRGLVD